MKIITDPKIQEYDFLLENIKEASINLDLGKLLELTHKIRSEGILYQDCKAKNVMLLETLLRTALDIVKKPSVDLSESSWKLIANVYDIVFHQVRLEEYPSNCANLYFQLSVEVLNDNSHKYHTGNDDIYSYEMSMYFILMAYVWFENRENEFLVLYDKLKPLLIHEPDDLKEPWVNRYSELTKDS